MTQRRIKVILYTTILIILSLQPLKVWSQYGIGTPNPDVSSILDLSAINKGVLLPRIALTGTNDIATITTPATSLLVYNTATAGAGATRVSPGYYYWDGTRWQPLKSDNLGNHTANENIKLNGYYLSNDGGNEGIFIATDGKVGIGTNSPSRELHINDGVFRMDRTSNSASFFFHRKQADGTALKTFLFGMDASGVNNGSFFIADNGTAIGGGSTKRLFINNTGNIGIGTTNPGAKLEVAGQVKITGGTPGANKVLTSDANGLATWQNASGDNLGNHAATQDIALGTHKIKGAGTTPFELSESYLRFTQNQNTDSQIRSYADLILWANDDNSGTEHIIFKVGGTGTGIERMRLNASGNLGIGTSNPLAKLHTGTTISDYASLNFSTTGAIISATSGDQNDAESNVLTLMRDGTSGVIYAGAARFDMSQWSNSGVNARTKLDIKLAHASTSDLASVLTMQSNGNIGVGTTNPGTKLDVNGQVKIRGGAPGVNKILTSDANGLATWQTALGDNLGNHSASENIQLGSHYLSGDGDDEGLSVNASGNVGVGTTTPTTKLEVAGQVKITGGSPDEGKILTSDANGLASWKDLSEISGEVIEETSGYIPTMNSHSQDGITVSANLETVAAHRPVYNIFNSSSYQTSVNNYSTNPPIITIQLDQSIKIYKYYIRTNLSHNPNFYPYDWTFEGSNDNNNWTILDTQDNFNINSMTAGATITLPSVSNPYLYYRLKVTTNYGMATPGIFDDLIIHNFQIFRATNLSPVQNLATVLQVGEDGGANRIVNVSQVGINTSSPTAALSVNGDANKTGSTAWGTFSDIRLKDIDGDYNKGLEDISALHTVVYNYKKNNPLGWDSTQKQYGLIAQEVQRIFPEAVSTDNNGYLKLDVHPINMAVYNAIRELNEQNKMLKKQNEEMSKEIEKIKSLKQELMKLKTLVKLLIDHKNNQ